MNAPLMPMRHLFWRFWWADWRFIARGLHFWAGPDRGHLRLWGLDFALQLAIVVLTVPGIWMAGGNGPEVRWGFLVLLVSQPFWLLATYRARHFGAFLVAALFTVLWARAVINSF